MLISCNKYKLFSNLLLPVQRRLFTTTASQAHLYKVKHTSDLIDPKYYKDDFIATAIEEIEFIRSPFYDLAKLH